MRNLTFIEWSALAQVVLTVITSLGIVGSLILSFRTLKEVQIDRKLRQRPHLAFDIGAIRLPISFEKRGRAVPGFDPDYVRQVLKDIPPDAESVRLLRDIQTDGSGSYIRFGHLKNYGLGTALEAEVSWMARDIWIGAERFTLDEGKRREAIYSKDLNTHSTIPSHIPPGETARLNGLPTFIEKDVEKKITRADGILEISCVDVFDERRTFKQEFRIFTGYKENEPWIQIVFSDLIR